MLTFELSAIDLILAIAVVILMILYLTKLEPNFPSQTSFLKEIKKIKKPKKIKSSAHQTQTDYAECPRGFGNIKRKGEDNSVSDRCLGCYRIMECYEKKQ